jgi:hypothetical protein
LASWLAFGHRKDEPPSLQLGDGFVRLRYPGELYQGNDSQLSVARDAKNEDAARSNGRHDLLESRFVDLAAN